MHPRSMPDRILQAGGHRFDPGTLHFVARNAIPHERDRAARFSPSVGQIPETHPAFAGTCYLHPGDKCLASARHRDLPRRPGRRDARCSPGRRLALLHVHEAGGPGRQGAVRKQPDRQPLDDWFGDISDQDWSGDAAELAEQRRATPVRQERNTLESSSERDGLAVSAAQALPVATTEARRAAVQRRRAVAALVLLLLVGLGAAAAVLLLRDGAEPTVTPAPESPIVTTPTPTETDPVPTTPSTTTPTPPPAAAPSENVPTFTLPEGMKLQRGESDGESDLTVSTDPELIADLQRALTRAGYDPGSPDGTFGQNTEEAVIAFQQANGLSPDGIVGPETADALSRAVVRG